MLTWQSVPQLTTPMLPVPCPHNLSRHFHVTCHDTCRQKYQKQGSIHESVHILDYPNHVCPLFQKNSTRHENSSNNYFDTDNLYYTLVLLMLSPESQQPYSSPNPLDGCLYVYLDMGTNIGVQINFEHNHCVLVTASHESKLELDSEGFRAWQGFAKII